MLLLVVVVGSAAVSFMFNVDDNTTLRFEERPATEGAPRLRDAVEKGRLDHLPTKAARTCNTCTSKTQDDTSLIVFVRLLLLLGLVVVMYVVSMHKNVVVVVVLVVVVVSK